MSIMDEIRRQDECQGDIDINSEFAINKMAEALCEYVFSYILELNKNSNNSRKIHGYILLSGGDKIKLDRFNRSLHIDKFSYESFARNHFTNHPPFKCFISEVIKDIDVEAHIDYRECLEIHENNIFADCSNTNYSILYSSYSKGLIYTNNEYIYLFPYEVFFKKIGPNSSATPITDGKLVSTGKEKSMNMLSQKLVVKFKEEGFTKSSFKVLNAKDYVGINVKEYKYGLFGKKKYIGSKYHTVDDDPNSKVIYFEVEW